MMPPNGKKHCRSLPPDAFTNLPDHVIDVILMRLPCKDAVRTSILSKKWRYHWCRLTELKLDYELWETKKDILNSAVKFTKIIYQILTLHEGPITKFILNVFHLKSCPKIDNFIYFLSKNGIQHLVLHFPLNNLCRLPSSLFTCSQLRHLTLHNCIIHHPSTFEGFDRLISLELCEVTISAEMIKSLISLCPLLERLVLEISELLDTIEINAPMLRSFDFKGCISSLCLKNVPLLAKVSLIGKDSHEADYVDFAKLFESCPALKHLILDFFYSELFMEARDEAPTRLPFDINSVKRFDLPAIVLMDSYGLSCALCWIRSFPYLEYLEIRVYNDAEDDHVPESLELERFADVTFNHLREVKLGCFVGIASEMQLIKLLLAKSPVLVRILIDPWIDDEPSDTRSKILAEVSKFSHASPEAEVVYQSEETEG
ncbi:F-box/FBD/LRR-repeat protein At1g13570-like [Lycium ferocissimum]|uniref:F-box/FBD/LRR-repeat protein At1g13570-like n=1 Tax=Lycium ferocissimum TaxID=112874 RepID=UPI00281642F0|nr:F-box/FBD/LRR-repeat protein At1g13570-like [Lycium ferocissimum]XP_059307223.1 F-box/FBD/LRR-repeat protein At1g13570-like [Lycium ferocissimum]